MHATGNKYGILSNEYNHLNIEEKGVSCILAVGRCSFLAQLELL